MRSHRRMITRAIRAEQLGDQEFKSDYGLKYAYLAGSMYKGIASKEMVVALARAGLMGFLGTGGLDLEEIDASIRYFKSELGESGRYGLNLLSNLEQPELEQRTVDLYLKFGVRYIEAAAFVRITPSLVQYRLTGIARDPDGVVRPRQMLLAKVSRPEVAAAFMRPAPPELVQQLIRTGRLTQSEGDLGAVVPIADDICVEADSGGHTDRGVAFTLLPSILMLRDELQRQHGYSRRIRVGAAGGIGTPQAAAAAFVLGADFILTGSINQCTREAGTSAAVKDLLQELEVQDTAYAPAGDMFELGSKVQVAKRGLLFPARANKLYELYRRFESLEEIDEKTRRQIEVKYFKRSFDEVWRETQAHYSQVHRGILSDIESNPKRKMALIFKWYFVHTTRLALQGMPGETGDYQIHCGPALGAFNQWVKGSELQSWRNRYVADLGERIMQGAAAVLSERLVSMTGGVEHNAESARTAKTNQ
jgi:trans-AT polyketide synthase/acyltransferase/oxidoreductase domain-containing protein